MEPIVHPTLLEAPYLSLTSPAEVVKHLTPKDIPIDASFPEEEANTLATIESFNKHLFRPNTYLHKWWARRSGATFRFILKQLVLPESRRDYYAPGGLSGRIILDPMCGGGTILHEAIRLGANVIGFDIDPIPVSQTRASLAMLPLAEKVKVFESFFGQLQNRLSKYFLTTCPQCDSKLQPQFYLYGLRKQCSCQEIIVVDSLTLRFEPNGRKIQICGNCRQTYAGMHRCTKKDQQIFPKGIASCLRCKQALSELRDHSFVDRYVPLVAVAKCSTHGQFFKSVDEQDRKLISSAKSDFAHYNFPPAREFAVANGPKSRDLLRRNIESYISVFTPRQLIYIALAKELLSGLEAVHREWLALLISTSLEFNSALCGYKGSEERRPGAIRHVFSHHAYSFPTTMLENNPVYLGSTSGTLKRLFQDRIANASTWAQEPIERKHVNGQWQKVSLMPEKDGGIQAPDFKTLKNSAQAYLISQNDSTRLPLPSNSVDFVVTDPPYFDSVQYSDLSNFFRVWLKWLLPGKVDWTFRVTGSAVAEDNLKGIKYGKVLAGIWKECNRVLNKNHGRLIFTFHHWNADAWAHLTSSLKEAGFVLVNRYTVHSENPISVHIRDLNALKHDAILVLRSVTSHCNGASSQWKPVYGIQSRDSYGFTRDCAAALGWMLESSLDNTAILSTWRELIGTPSVKIPS